MGRAFMVAAIAGAATLARDGMGHAGAAPPWAMHGQQQCTASLKKTKSGVRHVKTCKGILVPAAADIYAAGRAAPPSLDGGGGVLPVVIRFKAGKGKKLVFSADSGTVQGFPTDIPHGPAGSTDANTNITALGGLSGIVDTGHSLFLVGVFLGRKKPTAQAPTALDFTGLETFTRFSPRLQQVFYIGDGVGKTFYVPAKATRLFLGFADGFNFQGTPGYYDDNIGSVDVSLKLVG